MKTRNELSIVTAALLALALTACASGTGASRLYRRDLGTASAPDLMRIVDRVLQRFHYEVAEYVGAPEYRWETRWRPRAPFTDESELGITDAETRVIVSARARSETQTTLYTTRLTIENRVRVAGNADWNELVNTAQFRTYADSISEEFRKEFTNIGVRRY